MTSTVEERAVLNIQLKSSTLLGQLAEAAANILSDTGEADKKRKADEVCEPLDKTKCGLQGNKRARTTKAQGHPELLRGSNKCSRTPFVLSSHSETHPKTSKQTRGVCGQENSPADTSRR